MKVDIRDVIEAIEFEGELLTHYYNKKTGVIMYLEDESTATYKVSDMKKLDSFEEWEQELIKSLYDLKVNFNDYIQLPNIDEIDEYNMMLEFCRTIEELNSEANENKSVSELKKYIERKGYLNDWYDFRENTEYNIAVKWCEENGINYK